MHLVIKFRGNNGRKRISLPYNNHEAGDIALEMEKESEDIKDQQMIHGELRKEVIWKITIGAQKR